MRGRKPRPLTIAADDLPGPPSRRSEPALALVPGPAMPRIVLAVAAGELVHAVASRMECDRATAGASVAATSRAA